MNEESPPEYQAHISSTNTENTSQDAPPAYPGDVRIHTFEESRWSKEKITKPSGELSFHTNRLARNGHKDYKLKYDKSVPRVWMTSGCEESSAGWDVQHFGKYIVEPDRNCKFCEKGLFSHSAEGVDMAHEATANFKVIAEREEKKRHLFRASKSKKP
ncbi:hypothetical protein GLAREA_02243 [Glarea lozoyensis ATCC 20868]|uniref:Uncharacterized protein n=1 Tax=Glarea lozoyensis (strain ATCC 20868 / MF5171) TaxID=1116229 RepID=S3D2S1_GLAL2|nr:uncharacterized protein GLAREA_02243 [Glarea lozoyensis ATCC 20868]EPE26331.1 hypothetical protein GLAREA_02243 [Glarea lozoyensis ATCC 20868]